MKTVLFCGGLGTRIRDYSENVPKPMVPIGHHPILWHVMQYYSHYGHRDFVLCLGYKSNVIKQWFLDYKPTIHNDFVISEHGSKVEVLGKVNGTATLLAVPRHTADIAAPIGALVRDGGYAVEEMRVEQGKLDDVFRDLTTPVAH